MNALIEFIINLFRSPASAAEFVADPEEAMRTAGLPPVNPAQLQAIAATAAPAGAVLGGGDPIVGLQRAVAEHHNIASPFSPQTTWAPQTQSEFASRNDTEFASRNDTDWASNNDTSLLSPEQSSGANSQQGGLNLGFGDITFGDKTSNTATDGAVIADGDISGPVATGDDAVATGGDNSGDILTGDRSVQGDGNSANSGDVLAGSGSNVVIGEGNDVEDNGNTTSGGGDIVTDNEGPVIGEVDSGDDSAVVIDDGDVATDTTTVVDGDVLTGGDAFDMSDNSGQDNSDNRDYSDDDLTSIDTDISNDIITDIDGDMDDDVAPEQEFLRCIEAKIFYKHARVQTRSDALSKLMSHGMQARDEVEFGQEEENTVESSNSRMYPFDVHRLTFGWVIRRPKLSTAEAWRSAKQAREDDTDWAWYKELPDETVTTLAKTKREFGKTFKAVRPRGRARENRPSHTLSLTLSLIGRRPISAPPRCA